MLYTNPHWTSLGPSFVRSHSAFSVGKLPPILHPSAAWVVRFFFAIFVSFGTNDGQLKGDEWHFSPRLELRNTSEKRNQQGMGHGKILCIYLIKSCWLFLLPCLVLTPLLPILPTIPRGRDFLRVPFGWLVLVLRISFTVEGEYPRRANSRSRRFRCSAATELGQWAC